MKSIRRILSILLAGIVLISSIGVTVNQHICMGQVRSSALFVKAKSCGMMEMTSLMKGKGCCDEKTILVKSKATNARTVSTISVAPSFHVIAIILPFLYNILEFNSPNASSHFAFYKPPLIDHDITVLVQVFLI
jgi:hypothetical protein